MKRISKKLFSDVFISFLLSVLFIILIIYIYFTVSFYVHESGHILGGIIGDVISGNQIRNYTISNWIRSPFPGLMMPQQTHNSGGASIFFILGGMYAEIIFSLIILLPEVFIIVPHLILSMQHRGQSTTTLISELLWLLILLKPYLIFHLNSTARILFLVR